MRTIAEVILWGTKIGTVAIGENETTARFMYDDEFLSSGIEVAPLTMPLSKNIYTFPTLSYESFHGLPGLLADSLPDKFGNEVINAWLEGQGRDKDSLNAVERLCYTGNRGMGALEYRPILGEKYSKSEQISVNELVQLASDVLNHRKSVRINAESKALSRLIQVGTSAGGARAKALIAWNENTGEIRSGQVQIPEGFEHWLIKFGGVDNNRDKEDADLDFYTKIEYAYHKMALASGLNMEECRLYGENGRYHFMTRRFDRTRDGKKIHMQTLGAIAHYDFNTAGVYSYEQAAHIVRKLGMGTREVKELYRRMIFNILAQNNDDHVKNISFLMDKDGIWKLAPAYDVTYAYNPTGAWTSKHQMKVNGKREGFTIDDFIATGITMGIGKREINRIIDQVWNEINKWMHYADEVGIKEEIADAIRKTFINI